MAEPLSAKLRRLREAAGLSRAQLAERLGVTYGRIQHIETGLKAPSLETLHRWAAAVEADPHDLDARLAPRA